MKTLNDIARKFNFFNSIQIQIQLKKNEIQIDAKVLKIYT
jgi:hypothetical protein